MRFKSGAYTFLRGHFEADRNKALGQNMKFLLFDFGFIQAQAVGNHRHAAEGHGQGGQDGMQLAQHITGFRRPPESKSHCNQRPRTGSV
jgi:hypothetical protein